MIVGRGGGVVMLYVFSFFLSFGLDMYFLRGGGGIFAPRFFLFCLTPWLMNFSGGFFLDLLLQGRM